MDKFQQRVLAWMKVCFTRPGALEPKQRGFRFLEEANELAQAVGVTKEEAHRIVEYVYGRPVGDPPQELGGCMVALCGLATSLKLSTGNAGNTELARCIQNTEKIRARDAAKPDFSKETEDGPQ